MTKTNELRLTEIFYSIQGESAAAGRPCVFVRLSRCNLRCTWCDTAYSFTGGEQSSFDAVLEKVASYGCNLVEITGGEPLLQDAIHPFMARLCDEGYEVLIETSGSMDISPIDDRVGVILDFKAPGSGMADRNMWENVDALKSSDELKFVLLDRADFDWAVENCRERELFGRVKDVHFSPVHGVLDAKLLAEWILEAKLPVRLNLQVHKFLGVE